MTRILPTIHLSKVQKKVMTIVYASPTPQVAQEELQQQDPDIQNNISGALRTLTRLGLIKIDGGGLIVTDKGMEVMRDEYLIDEFDELTPQAEELLKDVNESPTFRQDQKEPQIQQESLNFDLLKTINDLSKLH